MKDPTADRHHAAARTLRAALTLYRHRDTPDGRMAAWAGFAHVITFRLTEEERAALTYWASRTLQADVRAAIFDGAHHGAERGQWERGAA